MKIWIMSDLHTEARSWRPARTPDHDVLVIAGDISDDAHGADLLLRALHQRTSKPVVFVPGNHDMFGTHIDAFDQNVIGPIYVLPVGETAVIDGVRFIGATLWTDWGLGGKEFAAQAWAARHMPEYANVVRDDGELIWPIDTSSAHDRHRGAIELTLSRRHEGPTVVVTHHAPSAQSLRPGEQRSVEAAAYASDLEQMMTMHGPDLWVHGHAHHAVDYHVGATRVVSNPRGYVTDGWAERTGFVEDLVIEV